MRPENIPLAGVFVKTARVPQIIEYSTVTQRMSEAGFVSLYHNSGAFGFADNGGVETIGWITRDDPTIRPAAMAMARKVTNFVTPFQRATAALASEAWLMPKSHWHYELHFGNRELLEGVLPTIGIDANLLRERNDGSAIAFATDEFSLLTSTVQRLLENLTGSDFLIAWPGAQMRCTVHHHKQLWWQTRRRELIDPIV